VVLTWGAYHERGGTYFPQVVNFAPAEHEERYVSDSNMRTGVSTRLQSWAVAVSGAFCLAVGVSVLLGWALDISILKRMVPGYSAMKPNAAVGFVFLSVVLFFHLDKRPVRRAIAVLASLLLLSLSFATLTEFAYDCSFGIDELLFHDAEAQSQFFPPGRMSPVTLIGFILMTFAMLFPNPSNLMARWGIRICLAVPLLMVARALVAFLLGAPAFYQLNQSNVIALNATIALAVASVGLILSRTDSYLVTILCGGGLGSRIARGQLLWVLGVPIGISLLCCFGHAIGLFGSQTGLTFFVVLTGAFWMVSVVGWSRLVDQVDCQHQMAEESAKAFRNASERDALTGLLNRRGFLERCEQELAKTGSAERRLACLVLDIDFFKKINDLHGHRVGDIVLCQFAAFLKSVCRAADIVGRIGGEEFCVVFPDLGELSASIVAERLRTIIAAEPFLADGLQIDVTTSGGVAELHSGEVGVQRLIDCADSALLVAKQTGRNKIILASSMEEGDLTKLTSRPLKGLRIRDIMAPLVVHVGPQTSVSRTAQLMVDLNVDAVPVVDGEGSLTGFITAQDLLTGLLNTSDSKSVVSSRLNTAAVFEETVEADEVASFFCRTSVQRVVVTRDGTPVGLVSRRTLLRWLLNDTLSRSPGQEDDSVDVAAPAQDHFVGELESAVARLAKIRSLSGDEQFVTSAIVAEATQIQESLEKLLSYRKPSNCADPVTAGATCFV
jgi:diguanylate cyclase (GGDEF)-like protein